jgi:CubicO group peptidase (beta-lactamase class C family)
MDYPTAIPSTRVFYGQMWQLFVKEGDAVKSEVRIHRFGHSGSDGTYSWVFPKHDLIILYFTQSRGQRTRMYLEQQFDDLFEDPKPSGARSEG